MRPLKRGRLFRGCCVGGGASWGVMTHDPHGMLFCGHWGAEERGGGSVGEREEREIGEDYNTIR
jgi:hypothetical protein